MDLSTEFWDCECEENFIHYKTITRCGSCCAKKEDQPSSRVNEVLLMLKGELGKRVVLPGLCPRCGMEDVHYEQQDIDNDILWKTYSCNVCGFLGKETFELVFTGNKETEDMRKLSRKQKNGLRRYIKARWLGHGHVKPERFNCTQDLTQDMYDHIADMNCFENFDTHVDDFVDSINTIKDCRII